MEELPSFKMTTISLCAVMIAAHACNASINITGEGTLYFENKEKLSISCTNNVESIVEFRKSGNQLTSCILSSGCTQSNQSFIVKNNISSSQWLYILETVSNFTTALCGSYECVDVQNGRSDTVNVSLKDFDNNSYFAEEKKDELSISTPCFIPASLDDLEITWYTFDNVSLEQMSDANLDAINSAPTNTTCPNVTCGISQAQSFTFGLKFNNPTLSLSFVEVKIVHPMFKDKPLIWRSSKQYPVEAAKPAQDDSELAGWQIAVIACAVVGTVVVAVVVIVTRYALYINKFRKKKKEKKRVVSSLPLFSSFDYNEKKWIADAMVYKHIRLVGKQRSVSMQERFHVIVDGELYVPAHGNTFGWSCGFMNRFTLKTTSSDVALECPILSREARKDIKIHTLPSDTDVMAFNDVKLLVMKSDSNSKILMESPKWNIILNGGDSKEPEESDLPKIKVDGVDNLIIIEASQVDVSKLKM